MQRLTSFAGVQLFTDRLPYPQTTLRTSAAAAAAFQDPRRDGLLGRMRGEGVPDLLASRAGFAAVAASTT